MTATTGPTEVQFDEIWRANRAYLVNLAYGILSDIGAAEDAVQESFTRLAKAEFARIEDPRGWLIVVTSRICIDQIQSARSRRERTHEPAALEFVGEPTARMSSVDPADRVTLDDEVKIALLVVLQRLKPAERVVFLLHDIFQLPFETVADTVGRPAATCRQLARRARLKIHEHTALAADEVDRVEHRMLADRFIRACSYGDLPALVQLLDPDAWGDADLGPHDRRTGATSRGALPVARNILRYFGETATLVTSPVGTPSVMLAFVEQRLYAVILLTFEDDLIRNLHVIVDPAKLELLSLQIAPVGSAARS